MNSSKRTRRLGFTLIELLVVIGIIAVLVAIGLTVATTVVNSGRSQATQSTLLAMESVVQDLSVEADLRPKDYKFYNVVDGGQNVALPIIDARDIDASVDETSKAEPSFARLLKVVQETVPGAAARWQQLDPSLIQESQIGTTSSGGVIGSVRVAGTEVLDSWGNPIRFVHPSFDGGAGDWFTLDDGDQTARDPIEVDVDGDGSVDAEYRRSFRPFDPTGAVADAPNPIGDADEGIAPGGSGGYLYSAGPDGDPGTRADNVYGSVLPEFPDETDGQD
ncbi:MAG: prepilin-type N-terminal cleavage/methylation domain-containing protein [Planctomycetota bacterium]